MSAIEAPLRDVRAGYRVIRRSPLLSGAIIATLALGIGLDTGVFTLVNGMLFRARVERHPETFVQIGLDDVRPGAPPPAALPFASLADYRAYRARAASLSDIAAWSPARASVGLMSQDAAAVDMVPMLVTCNYFDVFGADAPLMGRLFRQEECAAPGAAAVVLIGEEVWRTRFGADPHIVGETIALNQRPFTVIGVMKSGYAGSLRAPIWVPYTMQAALASTDAFHDERARWLVMFGRLKPGVSRATARAELAVIAAQQDRLEYGRQTAVRLTNGSLIEEPAVQPLTFWIVPLVMGALSLVLLIACANVTMLLLSRAAARQHEMAVRVSLGASRGRLVRMLLTESLLLSVMAVPLSAWIAYEVPVVFKRTIPTLPFYPFQMDYAVFAYLAGLTTVAGVLAGLAPALESLKPSLSASLQGQDALAALTRWRTRDLLVALQVAMSLVLLAAGGLFVRAEYRMVHADPGFEMDRVLLVTPRLRVPPHTPATVAAFQRTVVDRLAEIPGVRAVAHASDTPLGDGESASPTVTVAAAEGTATTVRTASINVVSRDFFDALNIALIRGRLFEPGEVAGQLPPVILSESLARSLWSRDPIGEAVDVDGHRSRVIGVVRDTRSLLRDAGVPTVYAVPGPASVTNAILVRFDGDARAAATAVRAAVSALDADAVVEPRTLAALRDDAASRFMRLVLTVLFLALVAGVLAIIGIYAVVAFATSRRTKEIGIRVALGATRLDIIRLVMASGTRPILVGLAAGTGLALLAAQALMRVLANAPVPLEPRNPTTYAAVAAALAAAAVLAMLGPAWRAASTDPVGALRSN